MLALYCADSLDRDRILAALPWRGEVQAIDEWRQFERAAPAADCSVVVIPAPHTDPAARRLALFRTRYPYHPVVLVTRGGAERLRSPAGPLPEEVVRLEAVEAELPAALGRVRLLLQVRSFARAARGSDHLPPKLREALSLVSNGGAPIRTVDRLAAAVGCDRRTLWNQWKQAVGREERLRLQDLIHWLLLLRAAARKGDGRSWADVADEIGVHPHTLGRLARQLAGSSLRDLAANGHDGVAERFRADVLAKLAPAGRGGNGAPHRSHAPTP